MEILKKLFKNLLLTDRWLYPGWIALKTRYVRTTLGPLWETLATSIFITFAGFLWSKIFKMQLVDFLPHLFSGMVIWKFYASIIVGSSINYMENAALIKSIKHEYIIHNLKSLTRDFLVFLHNVPICLIIVFYFNGVTLNIFFLFLSLPIVLLSGFFISYLMSLVCLRFRDLNYLTQSLIQLVFFFTPILWKPDQLGPKAEMFIVMPNIIYHYVEIIRAPIMGYTPSLLNYLMTIIFLFCLLLLANFCYKKYNRRIPYWI